MWEEVVEEGKLFYVNNKYGNVCKTVDGKYVAMVPRVVHLGPFDDLEQAKQVVEDQGGNLNRVLENYNLELLNFFKEMV